MITHFVDNLSAGSEVDVASIEAERGRVYLNLLLEEIGARGMVLEDGVVGEIEICPECDGEGDDGKKACRVCDTTGAVVDFGRGRKPFRE